MSIYRSMSLPDVPAGTVLHLRPGQWGWDNVLPLTLAVRRVRTDLWSQVDAWQLVDRGYAEVWVDGTVAGTAVQVPVAFEALLGAVADATR
jgi:hypothetical protein